MVVVREVELCKINLRIRILVLYLYEDSRLHRCSSCNKRAAFKLLQCGACSFLATIRVRRFIQMMPILHGELIDDGSIRRRL